jgi:glycyl-tRNA synthetase (class II)
MEQNQDKLKDIISHAKEYGFVFPSSEIYDGLAATYDYGQLGSELKNNIKTYWWKSMVQMHENIVGIDAAIFMHPTTWKASGHVDAFNDPLIDNKDSKKRYRADVLLEEHMEKIRQKSEKEFFKNNKDYKFDFNKLVDIYLKLISLLNSEQNLENDQLDFNFFSKRLTTELILFSSQIEVEDKNKIDLNTIDKISYFKSEFRDYFAFKNSLSANVREENVNILKYDKYSEIDNNLELYSNQALEIYEGIRIILNNNNCFKRFLTIQNIENRMRTALENNDLEGVRNLIIDLEIVCPISGSKNWTEVRQFNLMFSTELGSVAGDASTIYLRPETAQGIFVNFLNVQKSGRMKIPFGIAQIGKAFRNEIVARQFIFRMREFEQMEMQFFVRPGEEMKWYEYWKEARIKWHKNLGLGDNLYRFHDHIKLAHYANAAADIEYNFPMGFKELEGIHSRTDFDLKQHEQFSGKKLQFFDPEMNQSYVPYVVETSVGLDRMFLSVLSAAYQNETLEDGSERTVLKIPAV